MRRNKKGFTIVELVIVIAIIAILASVLIPTFSTVVEKANKSSALQETKNALQVVSMLVNKSGEETMSDSVFYFVSGNYLFEYNGTGEQDDRTVNGLNNIEAYDSPAEALTAVINSTDGFAKDKTLTFYTVGSDCKVELPQGVTVVTNPDISKRVVVIKAK